MRQKGGSNTFHGKNATAGKGKRSVLRSYDSLGGQIYDIRYAEEQEAKYNLILEKIKPLLDDLVLDDGCGTGLLLQRLNSHCIGVDISHRLLSTALSGLKGKINTHLIQADADNLPFRSKVFHIVFAVTLIQNLPSPCQTLIEIRRVSRPDSIIIVSALKKAFSEDLFMKVVKDSGLTSIPFAQDEDLKDWLVFAKIKKN